MRELFLIRGESTPTSLVFRLAEQGEEPEEQFFLEVNDELRSILLHKEAQPEEKQEEERNESGQESTDSTVGLQTTPPTPKREVDPSLSAPLSMRPREIQEKIRSGATVKELAESMGVAESRVEGFAYPVLQERARIAEMAKQSHPVRDDGPAKLTLFEVLATALAARGHDLADATWDAFRETSGQWVVTVSWRAGLSENTAEWTLNNHTTSSATAVARNSVAADLIDPDFVQPVRSLTSVHQWDDEPEEDSSERTRDDIPRITEVADEEEAEDTILQHPDPEQAPAKRRRRAVTPHWEDVLLGVRANTKRPRK